LLKASLQLRLGQSLTMTPQLQQAIRLLQLPTIELQAHIRAALESNVMLEQDEESDTATFRPPRVTLDSCSPWRYATRPGSWRPLGPTTSVSSASITL